MKIGFVGAGSMAAAMARGWKTADGGPEAMLFTDSGSGSAGALAEEVGGEAVQDNRKLAAEADVVMLAMKPAQLDSVAEELGTARSVVSLLGATPLDRLSSALPKATVVRLMPNVAVEVHRGAICIAAGSDAADLVAELKPVLELLGKVVEIEDRAMDAATAVMGCSPAYLSLVAEALADAGVREGLDDRLSKELVAETLAGTAELLRDHDTLSVRRAVASPGGSTAAGLAALERGAAREAFADAVRESVKQMRGE